MIKRRTFLLSSLLCLLGRKHLAFSLERITFSENSRKKARYYTQEMGGIIQCQLCFRRCAIKSGERGFCRVRENRKGELWSLVYGRVAGLQIDPVELEPLYHFVPGHRNLCVYTASCNFRCRHCHNWTISQSAPEEIRAYHYSPKEIVEKAISLGCKSISHSINEPTIFTEMMLDIAILAKERGLLTIFHSNGSIGAQALTDILPFIDAATIDLKAFNQKFYQRISEAELKPVLDTLEKIRTSGTHLEIVNLVIPGLNDNFNEIQKMCRWIVINLGQDVPLHFTRFSPAYKLSHLPRTPIKTLERARSIALSEGIKYVYIGNVSGHPANSTYCASCGKKIIERDHFLVLKNEVKNGQCPNCQEKIPGIF